MLKSSPRAPQGPSGRSTSYVPGMGTPLVGIRGRTPRAASRENPRLVPALGGHVTRGLGRGEDRLMADAQGSIADEGSRQGLRKVSQLSEQTVGRASIRTGTLLSFTLLLVKSDSDNHPHLCPHLQPDRRQS